MAKTPEQIKQDGQVKTSNVPDNFQGSAAGVKTNTAEQELIKAQMNENSKAWWDAADGDENTTGTKKWYEAENKRLAAQLGGNVSQSFNPTTGTWGGTAAAAPAQTYPAQAATDSTRNMQNLLNQWQSAATVQSNANIDYGVKRAENELQRALADAQPQFKEQAEQVAKDEMQGRDNAALYAELRGDKGGIGQEQYSSIMNTAAQNRLTVQQAQTKLATEVDRQIADLRAQGEFEKADAALELAQQYLSQLLSLEQWAASYNLSVAEFNESVRQWGLQFEQALKEYNTNLELSMAELTGAFKDGTTTLQAQNIIQQQLRESGANLLAYGIMPDDEQLSALGYSKEQAAQLVSAAQMERAAAAAGKGTKEDDAPVEADIEGLYMEAYKSGNPEEYLRQNYKLFGLSQEPDYKTYRNWIAEYEKELKAEEKLREKEEAEKRFIYNNLSDAGKTVYNHIINGNYTNENAYNLVAATTLSNAEIANIFALLGIAP